MQLLQQYETELYQSLWYCSEYEQVYYTKVNGIFKDILIKSQRDKSLIVLVDKINVDLDVYKRANPQFQRVSKGIVLNIFYKHSMYYTNLYKEVKIVREVEYTAQLYLERLIGYFEWMHLADYSINDLSERIERYNNRERKHVVVEDNIELNNTLNKIYKCYMQNFKQYPVLSQECILNILYGIHKQLFTAAP